MKCTDGYWQMRVQVGGTPTAWRVLLRGIDAIQSVTGGEIQTDALGTLVVPTEGASEVSVILF